MNDNLLRLEYIPLSRVMLWDQNPKLHDLGSLTESITKYGFKDPPKYEPELNGGKGGIAAGNGRIITLRMMRDQGHPRPGGIDEDDTTHEWAVPILFGVDAKSEAAAKAYAITHNNLTMAGGDYTPFDMALMYDETYIPLLQDFDLDDLPVTVDAETLDALCSGGGDEPPMESDSPIGSLVWRPALNKIRSVRFLSIRHWRASSKARDLVLFKDARAACDPGIVEKIAIEISLVIGGLLGTHLGEFQVTTSYAQESTKHFATHIAKEVASRLGLSFVKAFGDRPASHHSHPGDWNDREQVQTLVGEGHYILIDDMATSGVTLEQCVAALSSCVLPVVWVYADEQQ